MLLNQTTFPEQNISIDRQQPKRKYQPPCLEHVKLWQPLMQFTASGGPGGTRPNSQDFDPRAYR